MIKCILNEFVLLFTNTTLEECKEIYRIGEKFKAKDIFDGREWLYSNQLNENSNLTVLKVKKSKHQNGIMVRFLID